MYLYSTTYVPKTCSQGYAAKKQSPALVLVMFVLQFCVDPSKSAAKVTE